MNPEIIANEKEEYSIYDVLRDDIVSLRLRPGTFFSIKDICETYGIGRSPGRDALIRLEQEGLITFLPQRGTMVSPLDLERIDNERFIRKSIEENVLKDFIGMFSPSVILKLENSVMEQKELYQQRDFRGFFEADVRFHSMFYQEADREYCESVIEKECGNYKRMRLLALMLDGKIVKHTIEEHEAMIGAISTRDLDKLMFWFSMHVDRIKIQERRLLKAFPDLFGKLDKDDGPVKKESGNLKTDFLLSLRSRGL